MYRQNHAHTHFLKIWRSIFKYVPNNAIVIHSALLIFDKTNVIVLNPKLEDFIPIKYLSLEATRTSSVLIVIGHRRTIASGGMGPSET